MYIIPIYIYIHLCRINSGFYSVRSTPETIAAFDTMVEEARKYENSPEQPMFYNILCGAKGGYRVGIDECWHPELKIRVVFLDR